MISETVVTSSQSLVQSLDINQVSPIYEDELQEFTKDHLRFNLPQDYTIRLGCNYRRFLFCHRDEDELIFSMFALPEYLNRRTVKGYYYKENGFPKSVDLDADDDSMFFTVPKSISPFKEGDAISYEWVYEKEPDTNRMVRCRKL